MWARSIPWSWRAIRGPSPEPGSALDAPVAAAAVPAPCWWPPPLRSINTLFAIPDYFFGRTPEQAFIQPDNLEILINHLKCAAFELPITPEKHFGDVDLPDLCARLAEAGFLHRAGEHYHWTHEAYPADTVSLRSVTSDNFVIIDITGAPKSSAKWIFPAR